MFIGSVTMVKVQNIFQSALYSGLIIESEAF